MPNVRVENIAFKKSNTSNKYKNSNFNFFDALKESWVFKYPTNNYSLLIKILFFLIRFVWFFLFLIYFIVKKFAFFVIYRSNKNSFFKKITIGCIILIVILIIDFIINFGKIYPGVHVGDVDLSGKTFDQAKELIDDVYYPRCFSSNVIVYANNESKQYGSNIDNASLNEQLSVGDSNKNFTFWKTNFAELDASLPTADIVNEAMYSTRGITKIFDRLHALLFTNNIKPYAEFNNDSLELQIQMINQTIGCPVVNSTCKIIDGQAEAIDGSDGYLIDKDVYIDQLNIALFSNNNEDKGFVPKMCNKQKNISLQTAQNLADNINKVLSNNVIFSYKDNSWSIDRLNIVKWISIKFENNTKLKNGGCSKFKEDNYCIYAILDSNIAYSDLISHLQFQNTIPESCSIKFKNVNNAIIVNTNGNYEIPNIYEAINNLNNELFFNTISYENSNKDNLTIIPTGQTFNISMTPTNVPDTLSLDDAINMGIVQTISSYTTSYTCGAGTENRNHNIDIAAAAINNTICRCNGGYWSFIDQVGDTTTDKGYTEAGTIIDNRYSKSVGGGVCQVATTVFNAVYDSGFEVITRHNHDLYISSYPVGRDAAISYPYMDLVWKNNESSDVLMLSESNGYSITITLLGVNPQYTVKTETGEWKPGEPYKTVNVIDLSKEQNSKFVQTKGSDGKSILIKRMVYNINGELVRNDEFSSIYKPKSEIVVYGPGDEANKLINEKNARMKNETDIW